MAIVSMVTGLPNPGPLFSSSLEDLVESGPCAQHPGKKEGSWPRVLGQGSQESLPRLGTWRRPETSECDSGLEPRAWDRESDCVRSLIVFSTSSPIWEGSQSVLAGSWVVRGQPLRLRLGGGWLVDVRLAQDGTWSHGLVLGIVSWL